MALPYKQGKIALVLREMNNTGSEYEINGIDLDTSVFMWRKPQETYTVIPTSAYSISENSNGNTLVITDTETLSEIERLQIISIINNESSTYEPSYKVDITTLKDHYNILVENFTEMFEYIKNTVIVADGQDYSIVLPTLNEGEVWVKTKNSWRGFYIGDIENQVKELRKLIEASRVSAIKDIENKRDESLEDVKEEGDTQVERVKTTGADRITEQGDFQVNRVKETGDTKNEMLITTGNTQNTRVEETGDTQNSRVITTGNNKVDDVTEEGRVQVDRVTGTGNTEVSKVTTEGTTQVNKVKSEGNDQVSRITTEGDTQVERVTTEGDTQNSRIISTANSKIAEIEEFGVNEKLNKGGYTGTAQDLKNDIDNIDLSPVDNARVLGSNIEGTIENATLHKVGEIWYSNKLGKYYECKVENSDNFVDADKWSERSLMSVPYISISGYKVEVV